MIDATADIAGTVYVTAFFNNDYIGTHIGGAHGRVGAGEAAAKNQYIDGKLSNFHDFFPLT
jgi:hypothetical protein